MFSQSNQAEARNASERKSKRIVYFCAAGLSLLLACIYVIANSEPSHPTLEYRVKQAIRATGAKCWFITSSGYITRYDHSNGIMATCDDRMIYRIEIKPDGSMTAKFLMDWKRPQ